MLKHCLLLSCLLLLSSCATNDGPANIPASGTPSPLNTSANPWDNVNPSIEEQEQLDRLEAVDAVHVSHAGRR